MGSSVSGTPTPIGERSSRRVDLKHEQIADMVLKPTSDDPWTLVVLAAIFAAAVVAAAVSLRRRAAAAPAIAAKT